MRPVLEKASRRLLMVGVVERKAPRPQGEKQRDGPWQRVSGFCRVGPCGLHFDEGARLYYSVSDRGSGWAPVGSAFFKTVGGAQEVAPVGSTPMHSRLCKRFSEARLALAAGCLARWRKAQQ